LKNLAENRRTNCKVVDVPRWCFLRKYFATDRVILKKGAFLMYFPLLLNRGREIFAPGCGADGKIVFARQATSVKLKNRVIRKGKNSPEIPNNFNA